jgi:CheY-like chemotaxis protein
MSNLQILVVDDERLIAAAVQEMLKLLGHSVAGIAVSGEEAIQKAASMRPDLVLMDIRLKGEMDGIEAAAAIRAEYGIPIVFLTAHADAAVRERAEATDPYGYIVKPFKVADIRAAIEGVIHRLNIEQKVRSEPSLATAPPLEPVL